MNESIKTLLILIDFFLVLSIFCLGVLVIINFFERLNNREFKKNERQKK